jgi:hypothetical protein
VTNLGYKFKEKWEIEEQKKLCDFMKFDQSLATTRTQTLDEIAVSTCNPAQTEPKSKNEEPEFQTSTSTSLSMF